MTRRTAFIIAIGAAFVAAAVVFWSTPTSKKAPAPNTPKTAWLQDFATGPLAKLAITMPPAPLPLETFRDSDGQTVAFADFRGKVLLINYWATWCAPCRVEMPALDRLAGRMAGDDFAVLPISIDRGGAEVAGAFLREIETRHLALYLDPKGATAHALNVEGLPVTILADAEGREIARYLGAAEWDSPEVETLIREAVSRSP